MIWLLVALCWIISFLFAGIEAGLLALDPVRLWHRAKSGDRGVRRLQEMLKEPDRLLITVLLVTNAADITALIILTHELVLRLGWLGYPIAVAIALPVYLFLLGVLPKSLFRRFPLRAVARHMTQRHLESDQADRSSLQTPSNKSKYLASNSSTGNEKAAVARGSWSLAAAASASRWNVA